MFRKLLTLVAVSALGACSVASADVLWSSRHTGLDDAGIFLVDPSFLGGGFLEDVTLAGSGPYSVGGINVGYYNDSSSSVNFDVLVSFWDNVNYDIHDPGIVNTSQVGSAYRFHVSAPAGNASNGSFLTLGETGLTGLTGGPLAMPDGNFGVSIRFVDTDTLTTNTIIEPIFHGAHLTNPLDPESPLFSSVTVGSSDDRFAADPENDGVFTGNVYDQQGNAISGDVFSWGTGALEGNMYFELNTVPEPGSLSLLALAGLAALRRRR
jgi:hypothetical protein